MAFDAYVKIEGIPGESPDAKHQDWISVFAYSHFIEQPASAHQAHVGHPSGRATVHDFQFTKELDKSSPLLTLACCDGRQIPKVEVEVCQQTEEKNPFMKYTLEEVIVSSIQTQGAGGAPGGANSGGAAKPMEVVTLTFNRIKWDYTPLNKQGRPGPAQRAGWDVPKSQKL